MPGRDQLDGFNLPGLIALLIILAVVFAPLVFYRGQSPGSSDSDSDADGGGGGGGPPHPPEPPPAHTPHGGLPLDSAEPAGVRLRGHERLGDHKRTRVRRPVREPARNPHPTAPIP